MSSKSALYGILWIIINNLDMSIQSATIKWLSHYIHGAQIVFLYKLTVFAFVLLWVLFLKKTSKLKTKKIPLLLLRAFLSLSAASLFVSALKHLPLANAMALGYTEPLFASLLAILLFKEYLNKHCAIALFVGFIGVFIVLNPGTENFNKYSILVLLASVIWSFDAIAIKMLGKTEKTVQYLFYISLFSTIFATPLAFFSFKWSSASYIPEAIFVWKSVEMKYIPYILALALFYFIHLIAVFKAFQYANLSLVASFDFSRVLFTTFIGLLVFGDRVDSYAIVGSIIIVASSAYIIWKKEQTKSN